MDSVSYSRARRELKKTMERVCSDHAPIMSTRQEAPSVVMLSLEDYQALEETAYLLRSPENAKRLSRAIEEIEKGKVKYRRIAA